VAQAGRAVGAAREGRAAAREAGEAAIEAVRLLRRRFDEGMSTLSDLLQAEADAARLEAAGVDADARLVRALAALDFALGTTDDDPLPEGDAR
jgi:outer membrane protein TolC